MLLSRSFLGLVLTILPDQLVLGQYGSDPTSNVYLNHAIEAAHTLQTWYNETTGLWDTTGWWNSANCITTLADLTAIYPDISIITSHIFQNTFDQAPKQNLYQIKSPVSAARIVQPEAEAWRTPERRSKLERRKVTSTGTTSSIARIEDTTPGGFLNGFFDDESWWALAWVKVYDLTQDEKYLTAAEVIFQDLQTSATNATCGGVWWDRAKTANTAISNALYIAVAAKLAEKVPARRAFYLHYAMENWEWFESSGLINAQDQINDGIDLQTCQNNGAEVWSYNQGVILGALVTLSSLTNNATMIDTAASIVDAAIKNMVDANGILHDPHEPDLGGDGPQFKGVFTRNLKELYAVTKNPLYKAWLEVNANSIWDAARDPVSGEISTVWSGPFNDTFAGAASHSSGLDTLVAAAAVQ